MRQRLDTCTSQSFNPTNSTDEAPAASCRVCSRIMFICVSKESAAHSCRCLHNFWKRSAAHTFVGHQRTRELVQPVTFSCSRNKCSAAGTPPYLTILHWKGKPLLGWNNPGNRAQKSRSSARRGFPAHGALGLPELRLSGQPRVPEGHGPARGNPRPTSLRGMRDKRALPTPMPHNARTPEFTPGPAAVTTAVKPRAPDRTPGQNQLHRPLSPRRPGSVPALPRRHRPASRVTGDSPLPAGERAGPGPRLPRATLPRPAPDPAAPPRCHGHQGRHCPARRGARSAPWETQSEMAARAVRADYNSRQAAGLAPPRPAGESRARGFAGYPGSAGASRGIAWPLFKTL